MSGEESGDNNSMPPTNGNAHPDLTAAATQGKRKRSVQEEKAGPDSSSMSQEKANLHEHLRNLVDLLVKHDTDLKLLSCPFPASNAKPRTKRAKTSSDHETCNIQTRVESGRYNTLQDFLADIERASAAVIERNQTQLHGTSTGPADGAPLTELVSRIAAFKKHMNSLIGQAFMNLIDIKAEATEDDAEEHEDPLTVSIVSAREDKQALTMLGGSQSNPRQLFSSLQKPVKVQLQSSESGVEKFVEVQEELRETALPRGISATRVVPFNLSATPKVEKTLGEVFPPRAGVPQLEPPRKRINQSNTVPWIDPFDLVLDTKNFLGDRNNYHLAPLPSGQWLQYGSVTPSPSYWARVDKYYAEADFYHTHGDSTLSASQDTSTLQGVFSSFAPSFDSSGAVIQDDSKNLVWWGQRGAKRLRTFLSSPYQEEVIPEANAITEQPNSIADLDEKTLDELAQSFNPEDFENAGYHDPENETPSNDDPESRDIDEILAEISGLLETLTSYQKIRFLDLPTPTGDNSQSDESTPAPEQVDAGTPSAAERAVYESLKSNLFAVISNLPPYAIAKLNGDQLGELKVSTKIIIENPDWSGTMERDDYTMHQERAAAIAAQANTANRVSTPSVSRPGNFQTPHAGIPFNQRSGYTGNAQTPQSQNRFQAPIQGRQPSTGSAFTPATAGRPPGTPSQRPLQYSQATSQFSQANNIPQFQRSTSNGHTPAQSYTPRPGQTGPFNATAQGRTPFQAPRAQYAQTPSQALPYARSAVEQAALIDRNKAQLAAQSRQSSTPQPSSFDARRSQEGSLTPGSKPNGTPVQS
ncbi:hypothetical protein N7495_008078 [Penicillium taxi]|uniref:uncharacterized protein n=1 Tax=Penicillium taxi TaxID=168475 RepID=UPI0025457C17|nr:uncharacterized protein N7495_008078 [Penicillium taxi]KAJ5888037.1 hypothetical protein N7495_008078 [Penicillium taxi]